MSDPRSLLEHESRRFIQADGAFERLVRRRDRKRRDQRIAAGIVGMAVFLVAIWIVTAAGSFDRSQPATRGTTDSNPDTSTDLLGPHYPTAPWYASAETPEVDYVLDLRNGTMTPLPETILGSLGKEPAPRYQGRYAASPDGSRLAFVGEAPDGSDEIFVADLDGTGITQVTSDPADVHSPAWSPDGTMIAYAGHTHLRGNGLFIVDLATGRTTEVVDETERWATLQFTPDGSALLFTDGTDMQPLLFTVPIVGGQKTLMFEPGGGINDAGDGAISPDGTLVTYLGSGVPASGEVDHCGPCRFLANVDGTDSRIIPGMHGNPPGTWSPDGTRIVATDGGYVGPPPVPEIIVIVDVVSRELMTVANGRAAIWIDDQTLLIQP
jgi:dipeptidyl aminopeptidase/acylaminoacyl peptidase